MRTALPSTATTKRTTTSATISSGSMFSLLALLLWVYQRGGAPDAHDGHGGPGGDDVCGVERLAGPRAPLLAVDAHCATLAADVPDDPRGPPDEGVHAEPLCGRRVQVPQDDRTDQPDAAGCGGGEQQQLCGHRRAECGGRGRDGGGSAEQAQRRAQGQELGGTERRGEHQPDDPDVHLLQTSVDPCRSGPAGGTPPAPPPFGPA